MSTGLMINPTAGRGRQRLEELLPPGHGIEVVRPPSVEAAKSLFQRWRHRHRRIVMAGGDGTFHLAADALVDGRSPHLQLGLVPAGTGSDFNRCLPGDQNLRARLQLAAFGEHTHPLRLAEVQSDEGLSAFINVASVGLSGYVANNVERLFKRVGVFGYSLAMFHGISTFSPQNMEVKVDGKTLHRGKTMICAVGCGQFFGGGKRVTPFGNPLGDDLHVVAIRLPKLRALWATRLLPTGEHVALDGVVHARGQTVEIICVHEVKGEYDGEIGPSLPITIQRGPVHAQLVISERR